MIVKVNENWAVNVTNIKDIGLDGELVRITWLDGTRNAYQADNESAAKLWFNRLTDLCEKALPTILERR